MSDQKPEAEVGEFKGNKVITIFINNDPKYKFTFGLGKAKALVEYFDDVKKFIEECEAEKE